ncbi:MATE family efflux transporter [uncultured Methanobrevibacter sp.]|uniref:MATE family efflux transporter n=1 Tax=uncultured Methanobrevibacter sp. TaxID=253161 RepID=UPI0025FE56B3|nr:MATE family efflux transporter [uncultured Methanobrevibacter sp.]
MKYNVDFVTNPKHAFWQFSRPLLLLSIFEACYSFVDVFWVSQMDQKSFFAVGVAVPLFTLIYGIGKALGVGTNSIIAREIGQHNLLGAKNSILHGIITCIIMGIIIGLASFFIKDILIFTKANSSSLDLSIAYLRPLFIFSFVFLFANLFVSTLQGEGNSRIPTAMLIITNVLNLVLDPIFIFVLHMGVTGVSIATILSNAITAIYLLYWYLSGKSAVELNFKYFKPGIVYEIFIVAIPSFLTDSLWCLTSLYFNRILIEQLGQIGVLLYGTSSRIQTLIASPQKAFSRALISVSGHLFGANKKEELINLYYYVLKISIIIAIITTVIFFFIRDYGFALFSVTSAPESVFYIALAGIIIVPVNEVTVLSRKIIDGTGKSYYDLILSLFMVLFEIMIATLLSNYFNHGIGVLLAILIAEIVFAIIYFTLIVYLFDQHRKGVIKKFHHYHRTG